MKKRLESELISIAHRVLKLKNKSDVDQLYRETQKLYETLSVLKFYHENFEQLKSELSQEELDEKVEQSFDEKPSEKVENPTIVAEIPEDKVEETPEAEEEKLEEKIEEITTEDEAETVSDEVIEENEAPVIVGEIDVDEEEEEIPALEAKDDLDFAPIFELSSEEEESKSEVESDNVNQVPVEAEKTEEKPESKSRTQQISFQDLLGENYTEPVFVKPNDITPSNPKKDVEEEKPVYTEEVAAKSAPKTSTLNEKFAVGINVGLNDRIAFVKNLFGNSDEDYNRVISQLNTFDTLQEAQEFIEDMVKPDYNDWNGKDEYADRFMEIIEKKFA